MIVYIKTKKVGDSFIAQIKPVAPVAGDYWILNCDNGQEIMISFTADDPHGYTSKGA